MENKEKEGFRKIEELRGFAQSAYLDNPLPSLFKERLFVYLSRFCPVRYCMVQHVGFLMSHPAGDATAEPESMEQVIRLLKRPVPDLTSLDSVYLRLKRHPSPIPIPEPETEAEGDLFDALALVFAEPRRVEKARLALRHVLGASAFELVLTFLAYIRTEHYWTETHPELVFETDVPDVMHQKEELLSLLLDPGEAERTWAALERAKAEKALRGSEEKYHSLFNSLDEGFCIIEVLFDGDDKPVDYRFLEYNHSFVRQTGLVNAVGKTIKELVPAHEQHWFEIYGRVAKTGEPARFENEAKALGYYYDVYAFRIDAPEEHHVAVLFNDITERKKLEQEQIILAEISKQLAGLDSIAETMERLGATIGRYFGVQWCVFSVLINDNEISVTSYGWKEENVHSLKGWYRIRDFLSKEQQAKNNAGELSICNDTQTNPNVSAANYGALGVRSFIIVPLVRNGRWRFQLSIIDNKPRQWREEEVRLIKEITTRIWTRLERARAEEALRSSEERLRLIIESAKGFAIFTTNAKNIINSWNAGAAEIFGWVEEDIIGQPADVLFTLQDRATGEPQKEVETAISKAVAPDVRWHLRKDGALVFINGFVHPLYDTTGSLTGFVKIGRDITAQHNAEIALKKTEENYRIQLEKEVEQRTAELKEINTTLRYANENLQQFASIASHDLQEPLRKLKMFVSVLRRHKAELQEEAKEVIDKIAITSDRMSQLIREVLQYSKIAYGAREFAKTNLNTIVQNVLGDLDLLIKHAGASIEVQKPLPEIEANPPQMNQLFYNLLTNALKFRREDIPPLIRISFSILPPKKGEGYSELKANKPYIEIIITDNGIGFNEQYAEQIFLIFERLHSEDEYEGTGVGLALCKKIVENHSGHIYARSIKGEGTSFHVLLPVAQ